MPSSFNKQKEWLGYQDSNLGMTGSKPVALPLGDTPTVFTQLYQIAVTLRLQSKSFAQKLNGDLLQPLAVKACQCSGTCSKTFSAAVAESKRANTQDPVPVIRGMVAYCANHASACATGGCNFFTTDSQMLQIGRAHV